MSFSVTRQEIADALSTVDGVTGYTRRPKVWKSGDAIVLVEQIEHTLGVAYQITWRIVLLLSGDEGVAIDQLDDLFPAVCQALNPVAYVDSATPDLTSIGGADMTAIVIIARSE